MTRALYTEVKSGERLVATDITDLTFFPKGTILAFNGEAWSKTRAEFKTLWKICDGTNGTPNLVGKFLRGGTNSGEVNNPNLAAYGGGADSQGITLQTKHMPKHEHTFTGTSLSGYSPYLQFPGTHGGFNKDTGRGGIITKTETTGADCGTEGKPDEALRFKIEFTPSGSISSTGGGNAASGYGESFPVNTLPSYYTVIYIMKVA
ncbi:MAG: hypothetical protein LBD62_00640 [Candidatus Margulisbacteria bacterium]|jgi:hypothetical protein|nr:hypothetical protein [Candidatus Margulisiibacteriota bacterium]